MNTGLRALSTMTFRTTFARRSCLPVRLAQRQVATQPLFETQKVKYWKQLKEEQGGDYKNRTVSTSQLLTALRDLQSYRSLTPNKSTFPDYRAGLRAVFLLAGSDPAARPTLTVGDLENVLSTENGVSWRVIHDILKYGLVPQLEELTEEMRATVAFNRVHAIGNIYAKTFAKNGARTFEDLINSTGDEYGKKVSKAQKLALKYHHEMEIMIPRQEVDKFDMLIKDALNKADPTIKYEIMGSYRRGEETSSDIDMVVWHDSLKRRDPDAKVRKGNPAPDSIMGRVLNAMFSAGLFSSDKMFATGEKKVWGLSRLPGDPKALHRQVDVRLCPTESLPYMLLGNTGDNDLMRFLRYKAEEKDLLLNEYGMGQRVSISNQVHFKPGTEIIVQTEKEIFDKLELPYLEPHQRSYKVWKNILPRY
ncbi:hypothetical protein M231_07887 [Tremella mesenterica]|uniref:DNA polymerase n=1 Tax=Tremella mesenterica TaxID=5217 RepID=A0A4Q1B822_TREME|nr:hypothetical protein M231_07887 [Tremella mesenterica]